MPPVPVAGRMSDELVEGDCVDGVGVGATTAAGCGALNVGEGFCLVPGCSGRAESFEEGCAGRDGALSLVLANEEVISAIGEEIVGAGAGVGAEAAAAAEGVRDEANNRAEMDFSVARQNN